MSWIIIPVVLLVAAYLFYVCGLLRIVFGANTTALSEKPVQPSAGVVSMLSVDVADDDFALLWRTQVPALRLLNSAGHKGIATASIMPIYREFARRYPELCDGDRFSDWLVSLQKAEIVVRRNDIIEITDKGAFVLDCVERKSAHPESAAR
jgi:hypothetical protein